MAKRHYIPITADVPGVNDSQRAFIRKVIRTALAAEGVDFPCEVDVLLTNDAAIHQINKEMREVDRATDVLSFPEFELHPGELPGRRMPTPVRDWCPWGHGDLHGACGGPGQGVRPFQPPGTGVSGGALRCCTCWAMTIWTKARRKSRCGQERKLYWRNWGSPGRTDMGKFALYTIGFALLACVPAILLAGMFSGGGGDVAPFLLGLLAVGAVLAGAVCLKDKLDRMEETLKAVSKTLKRSKQNWKQ